MGLYNSKYDYDRLTLDNKWLTEESWVQYYRDVVNGKNPFPVSNTEYKFEFQTRSKTDNLYECLTTLYRYQSLDKFLEPDKNPHLKKTEDQRKQELHLLKYVFPDYTIECEKVIPDDADLRRYPSKFRWTINGTELYVHRNIGIIFYDKTTNYSDKLDETCFVCKSDQHGIYDCPNKCPCEGNHRSENHRCLYCDLIGFDHCQEDCEMYCPCGKYHRKNEHTCLCGEQGFKHFREDCPEMCKCHGIHRPEEHVCFLCEEVGYKHSISECPLNV